MRSKPHQILVVLVLMSSFGLTAVDASKITVGPTECDYSKISDAIEAADPGDLIEVQNGTYCENLILDKSIKLRGIAVEETMPILDANGKGNAITILANSTEISGFVIRKSGTGKAGIEVRSNKNVIEKNCITDNKWYGIYLEGSCDNFIRENSISNNKYGIWIDFMSEDNKVYKNELVGNKNYDALDSGDNNKWDGNLFGNFDKFFDEVKSIYEVPGGSNVDENPQEPEPLPELPTTKSSAISVKIAIPAPIVE